jgi:hypothetical protein
VSQFEHLLDSGVVVVEDDEEEWTEEPLQEGEVLDVI